MMEKYDIDKLKESLDRVVVYANHYYQEVWRHSYPIAKRTYSINTLDQHQIQRVNDLDEFVMYVDIPFCKSNCDYCRYYKP